jgi:hypothetical protein
MSAALRRRWITRAAIALVATVAACRWGPKGRDFPPAVSPAGARVAVRVRGVSTDRVGELYAADTAGVVVRDDRLARVRWPDVIAMDVLKLGKGYDIRTGHGEIDAAHRARLAAVSRFPQGLTGPLLARVLSLVGQPSIDEVR